MADLVTPAERIDAMARAMQDGSPDSTGRAADEYLAMLRESPLIPDLAWKCDMTPQGLVERMAECHLWDGPFTLGDKVWLMSDAVKFGDISVSGPTINDNMTFREIKAARESLSEMPLPKVFAENDAFTSSVAGLISIYALTRGRASMGAWCPGGSAPDTLDLGLAPRVQDARRMTRALKHLVRNDVTLCDITDVLYDSGRLENVDLGGVVLFSVTTPREEFKVFDSDSLPTLTKRRVTWSRNGSARRDTEFVAMVADLIICAGAWNVLDWLYAETDDIRAQTRLFFAYMMLVDEALDSQSSCARAGSGLADDSALIERAHQMTKDEILMRLRRMAFDAFRPTHGDDEDE